MASIPSNIESRRTSSNAYRVGYDRMGWAVRIKGKAGRYWIDFIPGTFRTLQDVSAFLKIHNSK